MTATVQSDASGLQSDPLEELRRSDGGKGQGRWLERLGPVAVFAAFVGLWYLLHYVVMSDSRKFLVPPPHRVVDKSFLTWRASGEGTLAGIAGGGLHDQLQGLWLSTRVARYVTLARRRHRLAIAVSIEDNGPGIPPAIRERIFYPLVSGREGGSGLGLTIAQTLVAQHNGAIDCDSEPGRTVHPVCRRVAPTSRAVRRLAVKRLVSFGRPAAAALAIVENKASWPTWGLRWPAC